MELQKQIHHYYQHYWPWCVYQLRISCVLALRRYGQSVKWYCFLNLENQHKNRFINTVSTLDSILIEENNNHNQISNSTQIDLYPNGLNLNITGCRILISASGTINRDRFDFFELFIHVSCQKDTVAPVWVFKKVQIHEREPHFKNSGLSLLPRLVCFSPSSRLLC